MTVQVTVLWDDARRIYIWGGIGEREGKGREDGKGGGGGNVVKLE